MERNLKDNSFCTQCPRKCGVNRTNQIGFCGMDNNIKIARAALHKWEEPCISYGEGSGTIFFSGCSLRCVFCQNYQISKEGKGYIVSRERLCEIMFELQNLGAVNINLVNPTHYAKDIREVLEKAKPKLHIPVIYNTGGYDSVETLRSLSGLIDVYLPDIKYFDSSLSKKYSDAEDYFETAINAVSEMFLQIPKVIFDKNRHILSGVIIRHLVLPTHRADSKKIIEEIYKHFGSENTYISIMRQYFPTYKVKDFPKINRRLTTFEYQSVVDFALSLGFKNGFIQEKMSASDEYIPKFYEKPIEIVYE